MSLALASAIMEGAIRGGASRQVAAAVASALFRSGESKGEAVLIDVPDVVADDIPVVAASMATQRVAGAVLGQEFHDSGRAYEAIRKVLPRDLARDVRQVNRAANKAKHGSSRGGKANVDGSWVANKMGKQNHHVDGDAPVPAPVTLKDPNGQDDTTLPAGAAVGAAGGPVVAIPHLDAGVLSQLIDKAMRDRGLLPASCDVPGPHDQV